MFGSVDCSVLPTIGNSSQPSTSSQDAAHHTALLPRGDLSTVHRPPSNTVRVYLCYDFEGYCSLDFFSSPNISPTKLARRADCFPSLSTDSPLWSLPTVAFFFFFRTDSTDSPDCSLILLSISVFYFLVFLSTFSVVGSVQWIKLTYVSFWVCTLKYFS